MEQNAGSNVVPLRAVTAPDDLAERTFVEMLEGWRNQQLARNLAFATINAREAEVRRFVAEAGEYPWRWSPQLVDEWLGDQRAVRHLRQSTIRSKAVTLRLFCEYIVDAAYGWPQECWDRFGTHPTQVCHDWNTATHVQEAEGRAGLRAFTTDELQALFDCADDIVVTTRERGRKGWLSAFRDATLLKVAYAWGLRRREVRMLDVEDFGVNPQAPEFGRLGVLYVRHGKAMKGSAPKQRSVLSVFGWASECLEEWMTEIRPALARGRGQMLWPTERGGRVSETRIRGPLRVHPAGARAAGGTHLPLPAPLLRHPPHRGWVRRPLRPGAGRPRTRLHHLDLHVRVVGLPHALAASRPGPRHRSPGPRYRKERTVVTASNRFTWRLQERMHERGIHQITALQRELVAHGIDLSSSQIHRLVTQTPERLNLEVFSALCEIPVCSPADLLEVHATTRQRRAAQGPNVVDMATTIRPRRARVTRQGDGG